MSDHPSKVEHGIRSTTLGFALVALISLYFADIEIISTAPWQELSLLAAGLIQPSVDSWSDLLNAIATTLAFAFQGMALAVICGFLFSLAYKHWWVRSFCAFIRAIHELFWALLLIQCFGLSPLTGVLALAIPYSGTLAKIYGELFEEAAPVPRSTLLESNTLSGFIFTTLPQSWQALVTYTSYRFECAVRSSVILGFIGLPTLGFYLESALRESHYHEAASLLYLLIMLIVSLRFILRKPLLPIYLLLALWYLPPTAHINLHSLWQFLSIDVIPAPLQGDWNIDTANQLWFWSTSLWQQQIAPGLSNTFILSQIALVTTAILALLAFPLNSSHFFNKPKRLLGDALLIVLRTLPEYLLAFILILITGPSMLPAIIALSLHNGAIIAHLLGGVSGTIQLREDASKGLNRYAYELLPRLYRQFMALLLNRCEIIMRESAILGILGVATLGFYVDSAFEEFRFDRAAALILISAILNICVDSFARHLRRRLHLTTSPETL